MSTLPIKNMQGESVGEYGLADELLVFDRGLQAMHDAVVAQQNNRRAGTAAVRNRAKVKGTGSKPYRQKGTGRARAGSRKSPLWRGGGVIFGPQPRSYGKQINRKVARLGFRRAFSEKVAAGQVVVMDDLTLQEPRTKLFQTVLDALKIERGALFVADAPEANVLLAARNIPKVEIETPENVNILQVLRYPMLVISRAAMEKLEGRLKP